MIVLVGACALVGAMVDVCCRVVDVGWLVLVEWLVCECCMLNDEYCLLYDA